MFLMRSMMKVEGRHYMLSVSENLLRRLFGKKVNRPDMLVDASARRAKPTDLGSKVRKSHSDIRALARAVHLSLVLSKDNRTGIGGQAEQMTNHYGSCKGVCRVFREAHRAKQLEVREWSRIALNLFIVKQRALQLRPLMFYRTGALCCDAALRLDSSRVFLRTPFFRFYTFCLCIRR